jgi:site-specific DNA-methyltransferase (adenine-specific)
VRVLCGDMREVLAAMAPESVHAIVTDPPYGLEFMGKQWDQQVPGVEYWRACLRVAKPGAYLLAFGGTRTAHRLACAIEDAGWELRDCVCWLYGCVTPDTKALSRRGWLTHDEITPQDELAQWSPTSRQITWARAERINVWDFAGELVHLQNRHTDQLLTPNHSVHAVVRRHARDDAPTRHEVVQAGELKPCWQVQIPMSGILNEGREIDPEYAYIVGWWLTDAWRHGDGKACMFSQCKPEKLAKLRAALSPYAPSEYVKQAREPQHSNEHTFYVTGPLARRLIEEFPARVLSWEQLGWSREARMSLMRGLLDGDGTERASQHGSAFWSKDPARREVVLAICVSIGWRAYIDVDNDCVNFHRERGATQLQKRHRDRAPARPYNGKVWCPTMPEGTWIALRNGRPFITGNSGFPKSHDISKAIDRELGAVRELTRAGRVQRDGYGDDWDTGSSESRPRYDAPATQAAQQWQGWGTAAKPAWEPVYLARKPFRGTVAQCVLEHGCGGLNIDGCRIGTSEDLNGGAYSSDGGRDGAAYQLRGECGQYKQPLGRWPANLALDERAAEMLDAQTVGQVHGAGCRRAGSSAPRESTSGEHVYNPRVTTTGAMHRFGDDGGASRFFYTSKASRSEREAGLERFTPAIVNDGRDTSMDTPYQRGDTLRKCLHPTVKPISLMRWLVRLVTPPGGIVLDPFTGSGSTGVAAVLEGARFIGVELSPQYAELATARIAHASDEDDGPQLTLFDKQEIARPVRPAQTSLFDDVPNDEHEGAQ